MTTIQHRVAWLFVSASLLACADPDSSMGTAGVGGSSGAAGATGSGAASSGGTGGTPVDVEAGTGGAISTCTPGAEKLTVLGFDLHSPVLYTFDPPTLAFEKLGAIVGCPQGSGFSGRNPWGAALDRKAVLWAHYLEWSDEQQKFIYNEMHAIDTKTGACTDLGPGPTHPGDKAFEYGLAFLPSPGPSADEDLYGTAVGPGGSLFSFELSKIDVSGFGITSISPLEGTLHSYLASSGDGHLYTLYQGSEGRGVRELDPATGAPTVDQLVTSDHPWGPWGPFAFWGGDLWVFQLGTYAADELTTNVFRIDGQTWEATQVATLDFVVTAASSSTCAPIEMPK